MMAERQRRAEPPALGQVPLLRRHAEPRMMACRQLPDEHTASVRVWPPLSMVPMQPQTPPQQTGRSKS